MEKIFLSKQSKKGITLIALVVTIVVLLILAGVSISMLSGENGIITQAQQAKDRTRIEAIKEKIQLWETNLNMNNYTETVMEGSLIENLWKEGLITDDEKEKLTKGESITIGEGKAWEEQISITMTLVDMYELALAEGCIGGSTCTNPTKHLHIGDYVDYKNPSTGSYTVETGVLGINYTQTFDVSKNQLNWRVLGKDNSTGGIKLIAGSPMKSNDVETNDNPYLYMYGAAAYLNGEDELNAIGALYKNEFATSARSVNINDIDEVTGVTTENKRKEVNLGPYYGKKQYGDSYSFENQYMPQIREEGDTWDDLEETTVSGTVDAYWYTVNSKVADDAPSVTLENTRAYEMLFNNAELYSGKYCWIASRRVNAYSSQAAFGLGFLYLGKNTGVAHVNGCYGMFSSDWCEVGAYCAVRPVVVLKANVTEDKIPKIDDKTEETWNYNMD